MSPFVVFLAGAAGLLGLGWWMRRAPNEVKGQIEPFAVRSLPAPFVLIGDSVGVGISNYLPAEVTSRAVSGYSTTRMLRVAESIPAGQYGTAIVEGHLNDMRWEPDQTIANLRAIYENLRGKGMRVVAVTATPWKGYREWSTARGGYRAAVNQWIMSGGDGLIDRAVDVRPLLTDPAAPGQLAQQWNGGDRLHLNRDGYRRMADHVWSRVVSGPA